MKVVGFFSMAGISNIAAKCNNPEDLNPQDFFLLQNIQTISGTYPAFMSCIL
jgi:hypothetical protein